MNSTIKIDRKIFSMWTLGGKNQPILKYVLLGNGQSHFSTQLYKRTKKNHKLIFYEVYKMKMVGSDFQDKCLVQTKVMDLQLCFLKMNLSSYFIQAHPDRI